MNLIKSFITNEAGATAVEYALILACITLAGYGALKAVGAATTALMSSAQMHLMPPTN